MLVPFPDLDIGVIYTHERQLMPRLLRTLSASGLGLRTRLILVDNASADGVEQWRGHFAETLVVKNARPLSYAANLNRILAADRALASVSAASDAREPMARYVLLLNTDMYFDPRDQCLAKMTAFMDSRPRCGIAGCRLYHADGKDAYAARRFQTLRLVLARRCGLGRLFHGTVDHHFYSEHALDETWTCDWLSGCFMMVRRKAIEEVGGFDEGYGKYFEDVDVCLRLAKAGWHVMYHGAASCYHLEQRASRRVFSSDAWTHLRSYLRWLRQRDFRRSGIGNQVSAGEPVAERRPAA
jgi:N-acetylglucosaminyl-diphospho-decaprenol L-rhamnosyltransferase